MKKSQTEIIGLMVIVVLFIVLAVIYITFSLTPKSEVNIIRESAKIDNLLTTIMQFTPCETIRPPESIASIIDNCQNQPYCGFNCHEYIEKEVNSIIKASLDPKFSYNITILKDDNIFISSGLCKGNIKFTSTYRKPQTTLQVCFSKENN